MNKLRITVLLLLLLTASIMVAIPVMADNDSMNTEDIIDVKPSIPFGGDLFKMIFAAVKWGAVACFVIGLFATIGRGSIATAAENSTMSEKSEENLFKLIKIMLLGGFAFIAGIYVFETFL